ncbi:MAG: histidine phosphatase family protein [Alphaproteobacteria bacterium]|jgi:phosphohistidine phosphatase
MKTLLLLRHAKAEPSQTNFDDFERALAPSGREAAPRIGTWLAINGHLPGRALVSTARRAQETWDLAAAAMPEETAETRGRELYLASPGDILAFVGEHAGDAGSVVVVGHNPGIETLARLLTGPGSNESAATDLARGMPTAGLAVIECACDSWADVATAPARLTAFVRPHDLADAD